MARKPTTPSTSSTSKPPASRTEVRNTPIPRGTTIAAPTNRPATPASTIAKKQVTREQIAKRAYEIWQKSGGSEFENWIRAERELRG